MQTNLTSYELLKRMLAEVPDLDFCVEWTRGKIWNGYGREKFSQMNGGKSILIHRASWELTHGPIPEGLCVLHHCDNRICFRPSHLFLGTYADNLKDCFAKGRRVIRKGSAHNKAKITEEQVREIRELHAQGHQYRALAARYGLHFSNIGRLVRGDTWSHI